MAINCWNCERNVNNRCEYFGNVIGMHSCPHGKEKKPKTRADWIRSMSDEELAEFLEFIYFAPIGFDRWYKWVTEEIKDDNI